MLLKPALKKREKVVDLNVKLRSIIAKRFSENSLRKMENHYLVLTYGGYWFTAITGQKKERKSNNSLEN